MPLRPSRSATLKWIDHAGSTDQFHLEENKKEKVEVFSVEERDQKKRQDVIRTYIYDVEQKYVIVLDPQRTGRDYYLITAFYLNKEYGEKKIKKLFKKRLEELR